MGRLTARNERQARLWGFVLYDEALNPEDVRDELEACCSDRTALEELRGHLSKTVALAERDRRNLLGRNDAVKGPGGGRAQLREWIAAHPEAYSLSSKGLMADLLIDIDSAERDREALAEARELLVVFRDADVIDRFLKRTEPKS